MQLPSQLKDALQQLVQQLPGEELRRASRRLTEAYKAEGHGDAMASKAERIAYLAVRLPATYAAVRTALEEAGERIPGFVPGSVLDLGSGPGTALWAAREVFPSASRTMAVERDGELAKLGQALAEDSTWLWELADVRTWTTTEKFDLVIASYSLGELTAAERKSVVGRAWNLCQGALVLVEPGTR